MKLSGRLKSDQKVSVERITQIGGMAGGKWNSILCFVNQFGTVYLPFNVYTVRHFEIRYECDIFLL